MNTLSAISPGWLTLLPPIVALLIAFIRKKVLSALLIGIVLSEIIQAYFLSTGASQIIYHTGNKIFTVGSGILTNSSSLYVLLFSLTVGALVALLRDSGGVAAFVERLSNLGYVNNERQAALVPTVVGASIFVETNLSILTTGLIGQKLFDKFKLGRARLALIADTTCAPVASIILINGWGAYLLGLIGVYDVGEPVRVVIASIPLNFYAWLILIVLLYTVLTGKVYGPLKRAHDIIEANPTMPEHKPTKSRYMSLPLITMIVSFFTYMFYTGKGVFLDGQGSKSIFYAVLTAITLISVYLLKDKVFTPKKLIKTGLLGMKALLPMVLILWFSMAFGLSARELGTGVYITELFGANAPLVWITPIIFVSAALASFTTGTSWGTYALLMPIGIPLSLSLGIPPEFMLAAIVSGGIWGDHCSPISDTTVVASLASGCDHIQHVKTQLPYAIVVGMVALVFFWIAGYFLI